MTALADVDLVLASTSRYRAELLARMTRRFRCTAPGVDEAVPAAERPAHSAERLAAAKATTVAAALRAAAPAESMDALVIGSDQVADLDGAGLGKPGSPAAAEAQLRACSGRIVVFHTAVCLVDLRAADACVRVANDRTRVVFRELDEATISRYVAAERPLDCAGSFKVEGLGITLFERVESIDPTALVGLPLIALSQLLRQAGITIP